MSINKANSVFWDEVCGSNLAKSIGMPLAVPPNPHWLKRFDKAYFSMYPYLTHYLKEIKPSCKVLEIGLGYGTVGRYLAGQGCEYHGIDIAHNPVQIMNDCLKSMGKHQLAIQGNALQLPYKDKSFNYVVSVGCLHHTGDIQQCVDEIHRVVRPGGSALVMLYNKDSFRQFTLRLFRKNSEAIRAAYDGKGVPHTDFVSIKDVRQIFRQWDIIKIEKQNFDGYGLPFVRRLFMPTLGRVVGLDLYIRAQKGG